MIDMEPNIRNKLILTTFYIGSPRTFELSNWKVNDIDFEAGEGRNHTVIGKGGRERRIFLTESLLYDIKWKLLYNKKTKKVRTKGLVFQSRNGKGN